MKHSKSFNSVAASVQPLEASALGRSENTLPSKEVLQLWRTADAVCFDVDSTVCVDEGIDELAEFCGAGKAVAEWTARAMGGSVPFEEALAARLSLFKPSLSQVQDFLEKRPPRLSPGIDELVKKLKANNKNVYLISGGFRHMINPIASVLGIPPENIFANQLLFKSSGEFLGFDANEPTSRSGGKAAAVQQIRKAHAYKVLAMIGDGATDLEARQPGGADLFICYGGVQLREAVAAKADWLKRIDQSHSGLGNYSSLYGTGNKFTINNYYCLFTSSSYSPSYNYTTMALAMAPSSIKYEFEPVLYDVTPENPPINPSPNNPCLIIQLRSTHRWLLRFQSEDDDDDDEEFIENITPEFSFLLCISLDRLNEGGYVSHVLQRDCGVHLQPCECDHLKIESPDFCFCTFFVTCKK
ncbi:phosphoserine phosphatase [Citrus sinensis]|nr:phosphoserine phosphatase [Citrus sinensis]